MNCKWMIGAFCTLVAASSISESAFAQSCASPELWFPPIAGDSRSGNTCTTANGGNGDDSGSVLICGGLHDRKGPVFAFHATFAPNRTFTTIALSGGAAGFDPVIYMTPALAGCGANQETCNPSGDTGVAINTADVPDGEWIFFVTAADIDNPGACGAFSISSNGSYPVTLTHFTVG